MIHFDVKCRVLHPVHIADSLGRDTVIGPGSYHLMGMDHFVGKTADRMVAAGTDLSLVNDDDEKWVYRIDAAHLAQFMAHDDIEIWG